MSEQMYSSHEVTEVDTGPYTISYRTLVAAETD